MDISTNSRRIWHAVHKQTGKYKKTPEKLLRLWADSEYSVPFLESGEKAENVIRDSIRNWTLKQNDIFGWDRRKL